MVEVPDAVNDHLYRMVEAWEEVNPDTINSNSTTQQIGFGEMIDDAKKADIKQAYINIQEGLKLLYA
jgi:NAD-dependent DNA ligase